ncbi:prepilin peptidase [Anabaena azotica]|uniref:Prepilin leader peptidase/N-methyltransferase n=1 Tax=Anabaena azotica FACHB-119 TaxID=947527 RepID=A0ABR8CZU7_9NOST|nr:A24 family peptidase [Anabaena azotica]MBD2499505.1 prepilin peptidase [Anabaena azotica FACHB-119]
MDTLIVTLASVFVFALGASIGSFINVVVYRLPAGLSLLWPPSRCPHCLKALKAYDNVPVLGWIWLKGRCRYCKSPISWRYPVVETATGMIFLLIFFIFKVSIITIGYWILCSWLLALTLIDLDTMTLPSPLTKSGLVLGLIYQIVMGYTNEASLSGIARHLMMGIVGAVLGLWLFDAIALLGIFLQKEAMGAGDAKLAAMMGAWLGWRYLLLAGFIACAVGAFVGIAAIILSKRKWGQKIPFGPFLALGTFITLLGGKPILAAYLGLFF